MGTTYAIFKKEFWGYFNSPIAYVFLVIFLLLTSALYFSTRFLDNYAYMADFFGLLPLVFIVLVPAVTMRLWAEEKKIGTDELLMTLPVRSHQLVLGKFLASLGLLSVALVMTLPVPITIGLLGNLDPGPVVGGYLGALLMAGAYLALGIFLSSLTSNQILAFVLGMVGCSFFYFIGLLTPVVPGWLVPAAEYASVSHHFESVALGQIDSRDLLYFLSFMVLFLYANVAALEAKKW